MHSEPHRGIASEVWLPDMWQNAGHAIHGQDGFGEEPPLFPPRVRSALDLERPRGRARAGTLPSRLGVNAPRMTPTGSSPLADSFDASLFAAVDAAANAPVPSGTTETVKSGFLQAPGTPHSDGHMFMSQDTDSLLPLQMGKVDYFGAGDFPRTRERSVTDAPRPTFLPVGAAPGARTVYPVSQTRPQEPPLARPRAISVGTLDDPVAPQAQALAPGVMRPRIHMHRATQSFDIKNRAPGHGRSRAGTIATVNGMDAWASSNDTVPNTMHTLEEHSPDFPRNVAIAPLNSDASPRMLQRLLEPYGTVESIDMSERGVAHVRFGTPSQALHARDEGNARLGLLLSDMLVDQTVPPQFALEFARSVSVAPVPSGAGTGLVQILAQYGRVEDVAQLGTTIHVKFDSPEAAETACRALHGMNMFGEPLNAVVSDAPAPSVRPVVIPSTTGPVEAPLLAKLSRTDAPRRAPMTRHGGSSSIVPSNDKGGVPLPPEYIPRASAVELEELSERLQFRSGDNPPLDLSPRPAIKYNSSIVPVSDASRSTRRFDNARFRELRKNLEAGNLSQAQADNAAIDNLNDIVELASNYVGNTLVQRFFEQCSESVKTRMLVPLAPHLATLGTHKNGTWAAQKIIDCAHTDEQQQLICDALKPYVPVLLLDQFGNYVVQCMLPFGFPRVDFVFDAMVDCCWEIGQGRFGARSMRTCLENPRVSRKHLKRLAYAIIMNCVPLATSSNGTLLLTWLLDNSDLNDVYGLLAPRMVPHVAQLCTHKLASGTMLRVMNQTEDPASAQLLLGALFDLPDVVVLESVLLDPVHGSQLIGHALMSPNIDAGHRTAAVDALGVLLRAHDLVPVPAYRRLVEQIGLLPATYPFYPQSAYRDDANDLSMYMNSLNLQNPLVPVYPATGKDAETRSSAYLPVGLQYGVPYGMSINAIVGAPAGMSVGGKPWDFPVAVGDDPATHAGVNATSTSGSADTHRT